MIDRRERTMKRWFGLVIILGLVAPALPARASVPRKIKRLIGKLRGRRAERVASQLADLGKDAHEGLLGALKNRRWKIRYWAAYALAYSKGAKESGAVEALRKLLEDRKRRVRLRAAMALAHLGDKTGLEVARKYLDHRRARLRAEAVAALAVSKSRDVVGALRKALSDRSANVRYWALIGLRDHASVEDALSMGLKYLKDRSRKVKTAAMEVLSQAGVGHPEAEKALLGQLKSRHWRIRRYAASVLARIGTRRSLSALRHARDGDRDRDVRATADAAVVEILKRRMKRR